MPGAGFEPARGCPQGILSPLCLPFHHPGKCFRIYAVAGSSVSLWSEDTITAKRASKCS